MRKAFFDGFPPIDQPIHETIASHFGRHPVKKEFIGGGEKNPHGCHRCFWLKVMVSSLGWDATLSSTCKSADLNRCAFHLRSFAVSMSNFLTSSLSSILPPPSVFLPQSIISGSGHQSKRRETDANGSTACSGDPLRAFRLRSSLSHDFWSPYCAHSVTTSSPFGRKNCIPEGPMSSHSASS